jgi:hypothetical protein
MVAEKGRWQRTAARKAKGTRQSGKKGRSGEKDVFSTERTQLSVENKGLSVFRGLKRTGF